MKPKSSATRDKPERSTDYQPYIDASIYRRAINIPDMTFSQINVSRDSEVRYWSREFEVTEQQLRNAVRAVGPSTEKVQRFVSLSKMLARTAPGASHPRQAAQDR